MQGFQYKYGDRPLEGYTIQRAVGRGGFGEVYYALSDGGREVALKVIQGYEETEIRGVSHCMNLKSPHLVTIFDVKHNDEGVPFVIMEYVAGPSLRELLNETPSGLGVQKAAFFLREIAKGLTYLHDRGIVHRDLKPGNIFYEDGYVKIGDYGLSKAISSTQHSVQTITVGTVHYMAPEIGQGHYDKGIDIYALGVVLYEMLTGQVPYFGSSHGEVLMKHLTAQPDLTGVEEPFATAISKALAKDPADRYASAQEMVEAVFGAAHIQESVSQFSPDSLSMVAARVARRVEVGGPGSSGRVATQLGGGGPRPNVGSSDVWQGLGDAVDGVGDRLTELSARAVRAGRRFTRSVWRRSRLDEPDLRPRASEPARSTAQDPLSRWQRRRLALVTAAVVALGTGMCTGVAYNGIQFESWRTAFGQPVFDSLSTIEVFPCAALFAFAVTVGTVLGLAIGRRHLSASLENEQGLIRRIALGGMACIFGGVFGVFPAVFLVDEIRLPDADMFAVFLAIIVPLFLFDWASHLTKLRPQRVSLKPAILAAVVGAVIASAMARNTEGAVTLAAGTLAGVALAIQVWCSFVPVELRGKGSAVPAGAGGREAGARMADGSPPEPPPWAEPPVPRAWPAQHPWPRGRDGGAWHRRDPRRARAALPAGVSDRRRLWAMLLAFVPFVFPVAGLHRFYVGKIGTGILWFVTLGLFYVGTIIDIILIATGAFTDRHNRRVLIWHDLDELRTTSGRMEPPPIGDRDERPAAADQQAESAPAMDGAVPQTAGAGREVVADEAAGRDRSVWPAPVAMETPSGVIRSKARTNRPLAFLGFLLLFWAMLAGLFLVLDAPGMMASGVFDGLERELDDAFGYTGWPNLLRKAGTALWGGALVLAGILLLVARARAGTAHVLRGVLGIAALFVGTLMLREGLRIDWVGFDALIDSGRIGPAIEECLDAFARGEETLVGGIAFVMASLVALLWPERRSAEHAATAGDEGARS